MNDLPRSRLIAFAFALLLLIVGMLLFWKPEAGGHGIPVAAKPAGGDFTLASADGPVSLHDFRGKVTLLYFGYTYCPDICPTSLSTVAAGMTQLSPEEAERVAVLLVSVDPARDTPAHLKTYAGFFHPRIVGVTGTPDQIADVARRYGVYFAAQKSDSAAGYVVDHTAETYVIAPDGGLAARLPHGVTPTQLVAEIRRHLP